MYSVVHIWYMHIRVGYTFMQLHIKEIYLQHMYNNIIIINVFRYARSPLSFSPLPATLVVAR